MIGLLALKGASSQSLALLPLVALTLIGAWYFEISFHDPTRFLPRDIARRPRLASMYALHPRRRKLLQSSAARAGHADLAALVAIDLLRAAMRRCEAGKMHSGILSPHLSSPSAGGCGRIVLPLPTLQLLRLRPLVLK